MIGRAGPCGPGCAGFWPRSRFRGQGATPGPAFSPRQRSLPTVLLSVCTILSWSALSSVQQALETGGGTSRHAVPSLPADSKALAASWEREEDARLSWAWKPDGPPAQERDERAVGVREGGPLTPPWAATDSTVPAAPLVQGFPGREKPGPGLC